MSKITAKNRFVFIYSEKILEIAQIADEVTTSDLQGLCQALAMKMYDLARIWDDNNN